MDLPIKTYPHFDGLELPKYQTEGSVGLDICAAIPEEQPIELKPFQRMKVPTGMAIQLPIGCEGEIRPRSGLSLNVGLNVILGTIDESFVGELGVIVHNIDPTNTIIIKRGMRIAQLVILPYIHVTPKKTDMLRETSRGVGGFGSTGN